jgi:hypothetical protein
MRRECVCGDTIMPDCPYRGHQSSFVHRLLQCLHRSYDLGANSLRYWRVSQCLQEMCMRCPTSDSHLPVRSASNTTHLPEQLLAIASVMSSLFSSSFISFVLCLFPSFLHPCVSSFPYSHTNLIINY